MDSTNKDPQPTNFSPGVGHLGEGEGGRGTGGPKHAHEEREPRRQNPFAWVGGCGSRNLPNLF